MLMTMMNILRKKKEKEDVEIKKEKTVDENVEKPDEVDTKKVVVDDVMGSKEIRKEQKQTTIPSPNRSPRNVSSSKKTVSKELTATVSPTIATTSKDSSTTKRKKRFSPTRQRFYQEIQEVLDTFNQVVPALTFAKTNDIIKKEMPRLIKLAVDKDQEATPVNILAMVSKEFATHGLKRIKDLF
uniref:Uncharacterized protein n=1 Tax=Tanacetum cinerariifolium TaxID=118510 RepID=A0A6L2NLM8_TANCI|nr:hypothetical protein [Tanacetum cinerariifolium]